MYSNHWLFVYKSTSLVSSYAKIQQCFCRHSTPLERLTVQFLWDVLERTMSISFIPFITSGTNTSSDSVETLHFYHNKASIFSSQLHCEKTKLKHQPRSLCACLMMEATDHQHRLSGTQVCAEGPSRL